MIPIHLKRFSHSKTLSQSSKVETKIRFPPSLDLTPYTTSSSSRSKSSTANSSSKDNDKLSNGTPVVNNTDSKPSTANIDVEPPDPIYGLSSVVVHKGKIDNGHYISYSKQGEEWFRFDDSMVVQVEEREALGAEAYMLFYVVRELEG